MVFQDYALFPWMTVVDNLALAIGKARPRTPAPRARQEAHHALARVGLDDIGDKYRLNCLAACASAPPSPAPWPSARRYC